MSTRTALGRLAESAVADYLVAAGYDVLARNLRLGALELDVVARRGPLVVVVEVRTRRKGSMQRAFESVTYTKRLRLKRAVRRLWREQLVKMRDVQRVRIDAAAVTFEDGQTKVEYVEGAIE
ncbi:MAG TPA: YraN family protein [Polyangiaceae bacterium]